MSDEIIYGESKQDGIPTPNNPVDIKSKNIFDSRKIIQQLDEIKRPILVGITQEDYIEYKSLKDQLKQRDEVIDEISKILNKHRFEENDDYYDCSEQGICITGWDDDYDKLNELLQKYKGDNNE